MERCVKPELLDKLAPSDPRAARGRKDLQRVNVLMGHADVMTRALLSTSNGDCGRRVLDLGAGDGTFLCKVARRLGPGWRGTSALLLDQACVVPREVHRAFALQGWRTEAVEAEALSWIEQLNGSEFTAILANLFLHHFSEAQLVRLLLAVARRARLFIALEPRRSARSLVLSRFLWFVGCSGITRYDARVSIRAGFAGREVSQLWPPGQGWTLDERIDGVFTHVFIARRKDQDG